MASEFRLTIHGPEPRIFTKKDIRALLALREETLSDLARRLDCSRESLSRLLNSRLNGRADFPILREKLEKEVARMVKGKRTRLEIRRKPDTEVDEPPSFISKKEATTA